MEVKVSLMLIVDGKINKYKCNVYTKLRLYINRPSTSVYMRVTRVHDTFEGTMLYLSYYLKKEITTIYICLKLATFRR